MVIGTWSRGRPGRLRVAHAVELGLVLPRPEFLERRRFGLFQHADDVRAVAVGHRGGHTVGGKCTKKKGIGLELRSERRRGEEKLASRRPFVWPTGGKENENDRGRTR